MNGPVSEAFIDKAAQPLVPRIVGPVKELASLVLIEQSGAATSAASTLVRGKRYRIEHDGHGILVPAHHPETLPLRRYWRRVMPVDGGMLACPRTVLVRQSLSKRGVVGQVDAGRNRVSAHQRLRGRYGVSTRMPQKHLLVQGCGPVICARRAVVSLIDVGSGK